MGQRGLARSRRAEKHQRAEPVGRQQPAEQLAGAEEMLLADELVEAARPHAGRQRLGLTAVGGPVVAEQVDGKILQLFSIYRSRPQIRYIRHRFLNKCHLTALPSGGPVWSNSQPLAQSPYPDPFSGDAT